MVRTQETFGADAPDRIRRWACCFTVLEGAATTTGDVVAYMTAAVGLLPRAIQPGGSARDPARCGRGRQHLRATPDEAPEPDAGTVERARVVGRRGPGLASPTRCEGRALRHRLQGRTWPDDRACRQVRQRQNPRSPTLIPLYQHDEGRLGRWRCGEDYSRPTCATISRW